MKRLPTALELFNDRPGVIPQVPEWDKVVDTIIEAKEKSLIMCATEPMARPIAMSIVSALEFLGYRAVARYYSATTGEMTIEVDWSSPNNDGGCSIPRNIATE